MCPEPAGAGGPAVPTAFRRESCQKSTAGGIVGIGAVLPCRPGALGLELVRQVGSGASAGRDRTHTFTSRSQLFVRRTLFDLGSEQASADAAQVGSLLDNAPIIDVDQLADLSGLSLNRIRTAIASLAAHGLVGYDAAEHG